MEFIQFGFKEVLIFGGVVFAFLWMDLHTHKADEPISIKNATLWSIAWVGVSLAFSGYIYQAYSPDHAMLFLSGYALEKSLSIDNLFVFMAIFSSFSIKDAYQHRVLYYGIVGALVLRLVFIGFGTSLLLLGEWVLLAFGLFVLWSAWQMFQGLSKEEEEIEDYSSHWSVVYTKKLFPIHPRIDDHSFFTPERAATPLFLCLVVMEVSDVMFAFDSVPAVIAVTRDPFLVYTSNIFAILGLRSMYFLLAAAKNYLCHLEKAVIAILVYIGLKMLIDVAGLLHIPAEVNLMVVLGGLVIGVIASVVWPEKQSAS